MRCVTGYDGGRPVWSESEPAPALTPGFGGVAMGHFVPLGKFRRHGDPHAARKRQQVELQSRRADGRSTPEQMQASRFRGNAAMQAAKAKR